MFRTVDDGTILTWVTGPGEAVNTGIKSKRNSWPEEEWYHLACVYDRANETFVYYVNAEEQGRKNAKGAIPPQSKPPFGIGGRPSFYSHAVMDEVKYYDEAVTAKDIAREYRLKGGEAVEPQRKLTSMWGSMKAEQE